MVTAAIPLLVKFWILFVFWIFYILYSWELDSQLPAYFRLQWSKGDDHTHKEKVSGHSFIIVMATIMQPQLVLAMGPIL